MRFRVVGVRPRRTASKARAGCVFERLTTTIDNGEPQCMQLRRSSLGVRTLSSQGLGQGYNVLAPSSCLVEVVTAGLFFSVTLKRLFKRV